MAITIHDIAAKAGVSHAAVSAALNGRAAKARIGSATVARIQAAAKQLGYQRNALAHAVVSGRTRIIGVITSEPEKEFIGRFIHGALSAASGKGYLLRIQSILDEIGLTLGDAFAQCLEYRPAGIYVCAIDWLPGSDLPSNRHLKSMDLPLVHSHCRGDLPGTMVDSDDRQGAGLAVRHLVALGHRRIAFLGGIAGQRSADERLDGFRRAMAAAGLRVGKNLVEHSDWEWDMTAAAARRLFHLRERPTAIICANDSMAAVVVQIAGQQGLAVPRDLSLVGFSNDSIGRFISPHLTTVVQPHREMGRLAVSMLIDVAEGRMAQSEMAPVLLPTELLVRGSTAVPPEETCIRRCRRHARGRST